MKYTLILIIIFTASCKNATTTKPTVDIPINVTDTLTGNLSDSIYSIKKSPGERHVFAVDATRDGDSVIVENKSK
jgi:hypothetical protein